MRGLSVLYAEEHGDKKDAREEDKGVWGDADDEPLALRSEAVCEDAEDLWAAGGRDIIVGAAGDICIRQAISRIWNIDCIDCIDCID